MPAPLPSKCPPLDHDHDPDLDLEVKAVSLTKTNGQRGNRWPFVETVTLLKTSITVRRPE
jgi:hypothetical protein